MVEVILLSYLIDLILGDPEKLPHPVRFIGKLIEFLDNRWNKGGMRHLKGLITLIIVSGLSSGTVYLILFLAGKFNYYLKISIAIYFGYTAIATKDLMIKGKNIMEALQKKDLSLARKRLSMIVTRDTQNMDENRIISSTVESIAENTNDGIVAPIFYLVLGGPVLTYFYKAVNTLDSMIGYRNKKYNEFGYFSAKMDDILNFIPARITGLLICLAGLLTGKSFRKGFLTILRSCGKHPSPNAYVPEAAIAGVLGIQFGGILSYGGKLYQRPFIGEKVREISIDDIRQALKMSFISSFLTVSLGIILKWII